MADRDRIEKLVGMLTSDFEGERANAAAFLARMAKEAKKSLPEFLTATLGSNTSGRNFDYSGSTVRSSWRQQDAQDAAEWRRRFYQAATAKAEETQRAERAERQLAALRRSHEVTLQENSLLRSQLQNGGAEPAEPDPLPWEGQDTFARGTGSRKLLAELERLIDKARKENPFYFTAEEAELVNGVINLDRDSAMSFYQRGMIRNLIRKLKKLEAEPLI